MADLGSSVVRGCDRRPGDIGGSDAANLHRGKRSIVLGLHAPEGMAAFVRLVDGADVFVEIMRPSAQRRLRIGPDVLLESW